MGVKVWAASSAFTPEVVASAEKQEAQKRISGLRALEACVTLTKYLCQSVRNRHSGGVPLRQRKSPLRCIVAVVRSLWVWLRFERLCIAGALLYSPSRSWGGIFIFSAFCAWVFFSSAEFNAAGRATASFEGVGGVVISPTVSDAILRRFSRKSEIKRTLAKKQREQVKPAPAVLYLRHKHGGDFLYGATVDRRHCPDFLPCLTGCI